MKKKKSPIAAKPTKVLPSYRYEDGAPKAGARSQAHRTVHTHHVPLAQVDGICYVSCTFEMPDANPLLGPDENTYGQQIVSIGRMAGTRFIPAVRFGMHDGKGVPDAVELVPWVCDDRLDHYGGCARPKTPYDFRLVVDLRARRLTARVSGRGDDGWFLLAEDIPLLGKTPVLNAARIEQAAGSAGVHGLLVVADPWPEAEPVRPHPLAKVRPVVAPGGAFRFQSMRSLWRKAGRHVTVSRDQQRWQGFADVVYAGGRRLAVTYCDGRAHGGGGKAVIRLSDDLGATWGEEQVMVAANGSCERLQRLRDGSILFVGGERLPTVALDRSTDGGRTWKPAGGFDVQSFGLKTHYAVSHVLECTDGAWYSVGSDTYPVGAEAFDHAHRFEIRERLHVYRSTDRGQSWGLRSIIDTYPSSGHAGSEASILELPDGRLVIYARDSRNDGYPGFRVFSQDEGQTWSDPEDLPIQVTGRVQAGILSDGRVMLTTRTGMGAPALWAWVEDPMVKAGFQISGIHFNDHFSKGLTGGALSLDSDGCRGQFTRYLLRPPDGPGCSIDLSAELMVKSNDGNAATISIPFVGKLRLFPERAVFAGREETPVPLARDRFHLYRVVCDNGSMRLYVDGELKLETSALDDRQWRNDWSPAAVSALLFSFGNYPEPDIHPPGATARTTMRPEQITPQVTGLSLWKRVSARVTERSGRRRETVWDAATDGFPDQYQLDHVIQVEASVDGVDQGYSGWTELPDGRVFVVNYTDDGAAAWPATGPYFRCPWIRGTYVLPEDLPPHPRRIAQEEAHDDAT